MSPIAYKLADAAKVAGQSVDTLKRAINATDPTAFPPPLRAKRQGNAKNAAVLVLAADLEAWLRAFPDA